MLFKKDKKSNTEEFFFQYYSLAIMWGIIGALLKTDTKEVQFWIKFCHRDIWRALPTNNIKMQEDTSDGLCAYLTLVNSGVPLLSVFDEKDPLVTAIFMQRLKSFIRRIKIAADGQYVQIAMSNPRYLRAEKKDHKLGMDNTNARLCHITELHATEIKGEKE